jgi:hypothetical protein
MVWGIGTKREKEKRTISTNRNRIYKKRKYINEKKKKDPNEAN